MNWAKTAQPGESICREPSCRRPIRWGITEAGKHQAVDLGVDPSGNLAVYRDGTGTLKIRQLKPGQEPEPYERRAMPHVATCAGRETRPVEQRDGTLSLAAVRDRRRRSTDSTPTTVHGGTAKQRRASRAFERIHQAHAPTELVESQGAPTCPRCGWKP